VHKTGHKKKRKVAGFVNGKEQLEHLEDNRRRKGEARDISKK
jgi:hypothetical protein